MKSFKNRWGVVGLLSVFLLLGISLPAAGQGKPVVLPEMMTWSAFDVGSRGYVQGAAISNALTSTVATTYSYWVSSGAGKNSPKMFSLRSLRMNLTR